MCVCVWGAWPWNGQIVKEGVGTGDGGVLADFLCNVCLRAVVSC